MNKRILQLSLFLIHQKRHILTGSVLTYFLLSNSLSLRLHAILRGDHLSLWFKFFLLFSLWFYEFLLGFSWEVLHVAVIVAWSARLVLSLTLRDAYLALCLRRRSPFNQNIIPLHVFEIYLTMRSPTTDVPSLFRFESS